MKILYFSGHPNINLASPSGPGTHMREVIAAFEAQGHTVVKMIVGGLTHDRQDEIIYKNPAHKRLLKYLLPGVVWQSVKDIGLLWHDRRIRSKLAALVAREKPDLLYERGYYLLTAGARVATLYDIPHIVELNAPYPEEKIILEGKSWLIGRAHRAEHFQVAHADAVVVVSTALQTYLAEKYPRSADEIIVTPNAINPAQAKVNPEAQALLRQKIGLAEGEEVIGFVGSVFRYHGVDRLIEAFATVGVEFPRARLLIVGDGIVLPDLRRYVHAKGLDARVYFAGNVPHGQVYDYISLMDIAVMATSNWYGSPVKVFEYGALCKAIIAPDNVPLRDVMQPGIDGLLVKAGPGVLEDALRKLLSDRSMRVSLGSSFHAKVVSRYTWSGVAATIMERATKVMHDISASRALAAGWNRKVLVLRTDFAHHGPDSGYKQLLKYLRPFAVLGIREGEEALAGKTKTRYQWLFEFSIRPFRKQIDLIHVMYAEDYLRFSPWLYRPLPVVATFHQPPETLLKEITSGATRGQVGMITHFLTRRRFGRLAAAIVTEANQKEVLRRVMPADRIHVIPLGVHLEKFHTAFHRLGSAGGEVRSADIITVGNWLRDWDLYMQVLSLCLTQRPAWRFHLVNRRLPAEVAARLENLPNLTIHRGASDEELKRLLFAARVQFLPVVSASGNNALMEGLAMGCPAVMTDVVSDSFPLKSDSVLLHAKSDSLDAVQCISRIMDLDESAYGALRKKTFEISFGYDWKAIAEKTLKVYKSVCK